MFMTGVLCTVSGAQVYLNFIMNSLGSTQDLFQSPIVLDDVLNYFFQTVFLQ